VFPTQPKYLNTYKFTEWKFQDFSVFQILREINLGESRSAKNAGFALLGAMKFVNLFSFNFQKLQ